jgi:hypothetical protein
MSKALLGYLLALPVAVPLVIHSISDLQSHVVSIQLSSPVEGHVQVFYDRGDGFSEPRSAAVPLEISSDPREYRIGLPPGRYQRIRIDPGTQGARYVVERIAVLTPSGAVHTEIPLAALASNYPVRLEGKPERLVIEAPAGLSDPQLIYTPLASLDVHRAWFNVRAVRLAGSIALLWFAGVGVSWIIERAFRSREDFVLTLAAIAASKPGMAVCATALIATAVATYPVLFLGKSLVSPNNGFVRLLYHEVPYAPGSSDRLVEDVRGNDVGATMVQGIPHSLVQREALAQGEFPLWNRYHSGGRPLWAQGLSYLLDPLHWITLVVPDPAVGWDLKLVTHRLVFAAGVGLVALAVTGAWLPSALVTAATPFIGLYTYRFNHPALFAMTYAPWALFAWLRLAEATTGRRKALSAVGLVASSSLVLLASTPKEAAIMLAGVHATGVLVVLLSPSGWHVRVSRLGAAALAGVATVLLTTPHWLIFVDNLRQSFTAYETPYVDFARRSFAVGFFLSPLIPGPVRPGLHLLALVLIGAFAAAPKQLVERRPIMACVGVAGMLMVVAFGAVPASWVLAIPFVRNIGHLHDVLLTAALPLLLIVCASGAAVLTSLSATRGYLVAIFVGAACAGLYANVRAVARDDGFESWAVLLLTPIAMAVPGAIRAAHTHAGRVVPIVAAAGAALALSLPGGLHAETGLIPLDGLLLQPRPRVDLLARSPAIDAVHAAGGAPARVVGLDWVLHSGSQSLYGLEGIGGPDPLDVPAYRALLDASDIRRSMVWFTEIPVADAPRFAPLLDVLNVGFLLAREDALPSGFDEVAITGRDRIRLGRRLSAWPRAFFVDGVTVHQDAADLLRMAAATNVPLAAIESSDSRAREVAGTGMAPSGLMIPAQSYSLTTNTTRFHLNAPSAGVAVLTETYLPDDFRATLNGQRVPYFRVNQAFKAVRIPAAGEWDVMFEYHPHRWNQSLVAAALGLALVAGLGLAAGRRL